MTKEEAHKILCRNILPCLIGEWREAISIATKALEAEPQWIPVTGGMSEKELTEDFKDGVQAVLYMLSNQPTIQPEIIRCKDCKHWVPGYITDNDDFIPPKCGEWRQMVGHSSDDYCSLAERREETT